MINDDNLSGSVTSYTGKAHIYKNHITSALRELRDLCLSPVEKKIE
jgi:hypothetical protein